MIRQIRCRRRTLGPGRGAETFGNARDVDGGGPPSASHRGGAAELGYDDDAIAGLKLRRVI
jgi:hypothetical protein